MTLRFIVAKSTVLVLFCCVSCLTPSRAQPQPFGFSHLTADDGLPDNLVWSLFQDHLGFIWFSSAGQLVKYDGYDMTVYDVRLGVNMFEEDEDGDLWMASLGGLIHFDRDVEVFRSFHHAPDEPGTISGTQVLFLHLDRGGNLWLVTSPLQFDLHPEETYLDRFDPRTEVVTRFRHSQSDPASLSQGRIPDNRIVNADDFRFPFHEDSAGVIWVGTEGGGLNRFDPDGAGFIHYQHDPDDRSSISSNYVTAIVADEHGDDLWVGTFQHGLNRLDRHTGTFLRYRHRADDPSGLCDDRILSLYRDRRGLIWVTTRSGICRIDPDSETFISYVHSPSDVTTPGQGPAFVVAEEEDGNLWLVSDYARQLDYYDRGAGVFIRHEQDSDETRLRRFAGILDVVLDRTGVLWLGTWEGGINILSRARQKFRVMQNEPTDSSSLSDDYVTSIHADAKDDIWVGTGYGLNRLVAKESGDPSAIHEAEIIRYFHDPKENTTISSDYISDILEDRNGDLWIATEGGGINRMQQSSDTFSRFSSDPEDATSLSNNFATSLALDANGRLWVGTRGGLNRFDDSSGTFTHYIRDESDSLSICTNEVHSVYKDRDDMLWVGGNLGGLCRFNPQAETFERFFFRNHFETVISIYEDKKRRFWVGTHGLGLMLLDRETGGFRQYTEREGLPHNKVKMIQEDRDGLLWIGTERGLARFDPDSETFRTYGQDDGLPSHFFTWPTAVSRDRNGLLFFGTDRGLVFFDPEYVRAADNPVPPPLILTGLSIYNVPVQIGDGSPLKTHINTADEITLHHSQNDISLDYAALHYSMPEKNQYAYMLEGYEDAWRSVGAKRTATYTSLDPGNYVFRVKASNSDGVWNDVGASLRIRVLPPFWMTWWFRSLVGLTLMMIGFGGYRSRVNKLEQKRLELEERVRERTEAAEALERALVEVEKLKNRLQAENTYLQREITLQHNFEDIVTQSDSLKAVLRSVEQVAATDATVLILGETGTGKELLARAIHSISPRAGRPLVKVNCAALPAELIESELFGHEKGAFTGAAARRIGRFELADGGTIFLDEIGDLPLGLQAKLLRVLQEGEFERVGGTETIKVDVRVIAATNRDLAAERSAGSFREDLFYRLSVFPIESPPLRDRKEDIPLLVKHFVDKYSRKTGKKIEGIPESVITSLQKYHWPGNVRELENVIERSVILSPHEKLVVGDDLLRSSDSSDSAEICSLEEVERRHILKALEASGGRVFGVKGAAKMLDINPQTLTSRMKKLGIKRRRNEL